MNGQAKSLDNEKAQFGRTVQLASAKRFGLRIAGPVVVRGSMKANPLVGSGEGMGAA